MVYRKACHIRSSKDWAETTRALCQAGTTFALILGGLCPRGDFYCRDGGLAETCAEELPSVVHPPSGLGVLMLPAILWRVPDGPA